MLISSYTQYTVLLFVRWKCAKMLVSEQSKVNRNPCSKIITKFNIWSCSTVTAYSAVQKDRANLHFQEN